MTTLELIRSVFPDEISLTPKQASKILNCHVRSVNRALAEGSLPVPTFSSTPNRKRILISDLADYMDRQRAVESGIKKRGRPVGSRNRNKGADNGN